jgi:putative hydrolase of the HAD superfamily
MLDWPSIRTVLLDMDGTLLDLHYDNHFWLHHVPRRYAEMHGIEEALARDRLAGRYREWIGTLQWYSVDFWSEQLGLDIARLKEEVAHLIAVHPHVPRFLDAVRAMDRRVVLVTNAHHKSLALKMGRTGLDAHFDAIVTSHRIGLPKEHPGFWHALQDVEPFAPAATLLVDDSLPVLRSARAYGIARLLAVHRPDTRQPRQDVGEFPAIETFLDIMPTSAGKGEGSPADAD